MTTESLATWYDSPNYAGGGGVKGVGYIDYESAEPQRRIEAGYRYRRDLAPYLSPGSTVLEVGSATGTLPAELQAHGHNAIACDLSARFAGLARQWYGVDTFVGDWRAMSIAHGSLDAIVLLGTISNLSNLPACLSLAHRQLRAGGFLLFNYPAADSLPARLYGDRMWMFTPSVMQFMTRRGAAEALARAGFSIEHAALDWQAPTLSKLLAHARFAALHGPVVRLGLSNATLPFALPVPGVLAVRARGSTR